MSRTIGGKPSPATECVARVKRRFGSAKCGLHAAETLLRILPLCAEHLAIVKAVAVAEIVYVHTAGPAVVYYIGDPASRTVKIGTSTTFQERVRAIRERFPAAVLLAVEPGHFALESHRHAQFAETRVTRRGQREWFHETPELLTHVSAVRQQFGDPSSYRPGAGTSPAGKNDLECMGGV